MSDTEIDDLNDKDERQVKSKGNIISNSTTSQKITAGFFIVGTIVFLPSSLLLAVGLVPTFVSVFIVRRNKRSKAFTIGSINLAGCVPFLLDLWTKGNTIEKSMDLFTNPFVIVVMYGAAAFGYALYWAVVSIVSGIMYKKAVKETKVLRERQVELVERWGLEVTGELKLNEFGFPAPGELERHEQEKKKREAEEKRAALEAAAEAEEQPA